MFAQEDCVLVSPRGERLVAVSSNKGKDKDREKVVGRAEYNLESKKKSAEEIRVLRDEERNLLRININLRRLELKAQDKDKGLNDFETESTSEAVTLDFGNEVLSVGLDESCMKTIARNNGSIVTNNIDTSSDSSDFDSNIDLMHINDYDVIDDNSCAEDNIAAMEYSILLEQLQSILDMPNSKPLPTTVSDDYIDDEIDDDDDDDCFEDCDMIQLEPANNDVDFNLSASSSSFEELPDMICAPDPLSMTLPLNVGNAWMETIFPSLKEEESIVDNEYDRLKNKLISHFGFDVFWNVVEFLETIDCSVDDEEQEEYLLDGIEEIVGFEGLSFLDDFLYFVANK